MNTDQSNEIGLLSFLVLIEHHVKYLLEAEHHEERREQEQDALHGDHVEQVHANNLREYDPISHQ